jgi:hypothetical protein
MTVHKISLNTCLITYQVSQIETGGGFSYISVKREYTGVTLVSIDASYAKYRVSCIILIMRVRADFFVKNFLRFWVG